MYIDRITTMSRQAFQALSGAQGRQTQSGQLVDMLNEKALSSLDAAREKLVMLRDALLESFDPDIEKVLEGYRTLSARYRSSKEELDYQQGQLNQYNALTSQRGSLEQELSDTMANYQDSVEAYGDQTGGDELSPVGAEQLALKDQIHTLQASLSEVNSQLTSLVNENNYRMGLWSYENRAKGIVDRSLQFSGFQAEEETKENPGKEREEEPYTVENFGERFGEHIEALQDEVKANNQAIMDYCNRYGISSYQFETYLEERKNLYSLYYEAEQNLLDMLRQDGEHADRQVDLWA